MAQPPRSGSPQALVKQQGAYHWLLATGYWLPVRTTGQERLTYRIACAHGGEF